MNNSINLLIIEDDEIVARTIERSLRGQEFKITTVNSGVDGLKTARRAIPDLVILDIVMPGMDGYTVCREMRADPLLTHVPILFLTAKIKDEDKIAGFMAGADDYLTKPFNVDELILRLRAILRRTQAQKTLPASSNGSAENSPADGTKIVIGSYILDTRTYELATPHYGKLRLTPVQYDLLYHLMSHPGRIFSPARLLDEVWDYPANTGSPDLVRVHIKNLRERIEEDPSTPTFIRTVPGYGYTVGNE
jgi:two-component system alkaline phosphatase synthesis response regulator PhoP/two-component system response regulator RpaA